MRICSVMVEGFKSFREKQEITFPEEPGLYWLTGENHVDPELGSNGAGKSTLWDAVLWCLYGKAARGLFANDIVSWGRDVSGEPDTVVEVEVGFGGDEVWRLRREQNPNDFLMMNADPCNPNGMESVSDEKFVELFGLDYDAFLHSVLMGQFNEFFFDMTPTPQLDLLSGVLDLDFWLEASDAARAEAKGFEGGIEDAKSSILTERQRLDDAITILDGYKEERARMMEEREEKWEELREQYKEYKRRIATLTDKRDELGYVVDEKKKLVEEQDTEVSVLRDRKDTRRQRMTALRGEVKRCREEVERLEGEIKKLYDMDGKCPYCNQPVTVEHVEEEEERLRDEISEWEAEWDEVEADLEQVRGEVEGLDKEIGEVKRLRSEEREELNKVKEEWNEVRGELRDMKTRRDNVGEWMEELEEQDDPFGTLITEQKKEIREHHARWNEHRTDLRDIEYTQGLYTYWKKKFKEVRLWIVDRTLRTLEMEVNNSLDALGMDGWDVLFDVERETKSGSISKGLHTFICPPWADGEEGRIPWRSWSGGETQRLRVGGAIGLSDLILERARLKGGVEVWDEPTAHLNPKGREDLLRWLDERAKSEGKTIWLIDHRSLDYPFEGVLRVDRYEDRGSVVGWD